MIPKRMTIKQSKLDSLPCFFYAFLSLLLIDQIAKTEYEDVMHAFDMGWSRIPTHMLVVIMICFICAIGYVVQGVFKIYTPEPVMHIDRGALHVYIKYKKVPIRVSLYRVKEANIIDRHSLRLLQIPLDNEVFFLPTKLINGEIANGQITLRLPKKERNRLEDIIEIIHYRKEYSHQVECLKENYSLLLAMLYHLRIDTLIPEMRMMDNILSLLDQSVVDWHQIKTIHKQMYLLNGGLPTHQLRHIQRQKIEELKGRFNRALRRIEEVLEEVQ